MISAEVQHLLKLADESHDVAKVLIDNGHAGFSAAQSYYTIFYLAQAMLLAKGLTYSKHSAVVAAYEKEFAKTNLLDPKLHIKKSRNLSIAALRDNFLPLTYFSGMAEINARRALLTCSAVLNTFATSGSITATRGESFIRLAKRLAFALL